jgi:hypothetical protein
MQTPFFNGATTGSKRRSIPNRMMTPPRLPSGVGFLGSIKGKPESETTGRYKQGSLDPRREILSGAIAEPAI